jgi:hypothetical protein
MIRINIAKAKGIAHDKRRKARDKEMAPHDEVISKQIPGNSAQQAEQARAALRSKYATIQTDIDAAADVAALKAIVEQFS